MGRFPDAGVTDVTLHQAPKPNPRRKRHRKPGLRPPVGAAARNAEKTECVQGHSLADAYVSFTKRGHLHRKCRTCELNRQAAKRAAQPKRPERVGPRGAAAFALTSLTCRRGHPWSPENTIVRGGESKLAGTRLCRRCRNWRHDQLVLETMRAKANARADELYRQREAEDRAFNDRRLRRVGYVADAVMRERRLLLHRWEP